MSKLKEYVLDRARPEAACAALLSDWAVDSNRVFALRARHVPGDVRGFYDDLFPKLGRPSSLAEDARLGDRTGQRTGGVWMEVRYDPSIPDAYRHSANAQPLHTDGSYIPSFPNATLMCCIANAAKGGETVFIHTDDVVAVLQAEDPALLKDLVETTVLHERSGDRRESPILYRFRDTWKVNWNYYCVAKSAPAHVKTLSDRFHRYLQESPGIRRNMIEVKLNPGDAVTWKDELVLHGRNAFEAQSAGERFIWKCAIDIGQLGSAA